MSDLTVKILQEIRDEVRGIREDNTALNGNLASMREEMQAGFAQANVRFEVIETTLRDLAQQLVLHGRAIRIALETRAANEDRFDDHERRIAELERRLGP